MMETLILFVQNLYLAVYYWIESIIIWLIPPRFITRCISNETVLITGGGNGIGRQLALLLARKNAKIVLWDINEEALNDTKKMITDLGKKCYIYVCDIRNRSNVYETAKKVNEEVGRVTILVNNAGVADKRKFMEKSDEDIIKTFEVNTLAHFWTCKAFLPSMIEENRGHIVSVASYAGYAGTMGLTEYCASKFAVVGFLESLKMELYDDEVEGVFFTEVSPYFINTQLFRGIESRFIPVQQPEDIAKQIMNAILTRKEYLFTPSILWPLTVIKQLLPSRSLYYGGKAFGIVEAVHSSMK